MILSYAPYVQAFEITQEIVSMDLCVTYASNVVADLEKLPDVNFSDDAVYLSQPIEIVNDNNPFNYAFFIFDQNICVGEIVVNYDNGEFSSSYLSAEISAVSSAYRNRTAFNLVSFDNALLMCSIDSTEIIVGNTSSDEYCTDLLERYRNADIELTVDRAVLKLSKVQLSGQPRFSGLPYTSTTLDVPYVVNGSINQEGICWAAATASIIRFLTPYTAITAEAVYDVAVETGGKIPGTNGAVLFALNACGVSGYTDANHAMNFMSVTSRINAGYPIYIAIDGINNMDQDVYHAIVICGYLCESDGTDYIQILDSNVSTGKIWITIDRSTNEYIYQTPYGMVFTGWYRSIYKETIV